MLITRATPAIGIEDPVLGDWETPTTFSFTTANGERLALANVTEPFATPLGAMVSQLLPV